MNFYQLVLAAMKVENFEISNRERNQKRKFARGGSSSCKIIKESQVESVYSSAAKGRRQGIIVEPSFGRGTSTGQGEILECPYCHKRSLGICRWLLEDASDVEVQTISWKIVQENRENLGILKAVVGEDKMHL